MSGRSRRVVMALVVVMSLLVATAPVAQAQAVSGSLEVASQHTTFGTGSGESSPATLTNVSVVGSGESADVRYGGTQTTTTASRPADDTSSSTTGTFGLRIEPTTDLDGVQADISDSTSGATTAYLFNASSGAQLGTADVSGLSAGESFSINADLEADQPYNLVLNDSGNSWTRGYYDSPSFPYTSGDINITNGAAQETFTNVDAIALNNVTALKDGAQSQTGQYVSATHAAGEVQKGFTNITLMNATADVAWLTDTDDDGTFETTVNSTTYTTDGNKTLALDTQYDDWRVNVTFNNQSGKTTAELHDEGVLFDASAPSGSNLDPADGSDIESHDGDISIDVNDTDFGLSQGDTVTVTADNQNGQIDQTTVNSNGTVTFSYTALAGQNNITWTLSDSYGQSTTVDQQFSIPGNLTVRKETNETEIINSPITVHGTFYPDEGVTVVEKNTTTGNISMEGLPAGDEFVVTLEADGYYNREIYLEDIFEQQNVYLLNSTQFPDAKTVEFVLDDRTGRFNPDDSTIRIQRALDPDDDGNSTWTTVAGDKFNAAGAYFFTGETGARYRVIVENDQNERRVLGPYTMTESRVENLVIGQVEWPALNGSATAFAANVTQDPVTSVTPPAIAVRYQDPMNNTTDLTVTVVERGNTSNQIFTDSVTGNTSRYYNEVNLTESQANNKTWLVNASYTYQGDSYTQTRVVGTKTLDLPIDPNWLGGAIFVFIPMLITLFGPRTWQYGLGITLGVVGIFMMFTWIDIPLAAYAAAIVIAIGGVMRTELTLQ